MSDQIKIIQLIHELNRRSARAVVSQLSFRSTAASNYLRAQFEKLPGEDGSFLTDPVFEATFSWQESSKSMEQLKDNLLSDGVLEALSNPPKKPEDLTEYKFPLDRHPYKHQLTAWETLLSEQRKSVLVSSGTGSGKTECFLVPIIEDLYREYEVNQTPLTGVRALFLYPLNALINSQRERLKAWTHGFDGGVRFCLYNGETPTKRTKASVMNESPEEVRDRTILREDPSPILVTNSTMLEYMLVRNDDLPIVEKSQGKLRWIVLDEAHTYIGSQAAELALLLRRVIDAFGVKAEDVRFVATSATIGGGDEKSLLDLQKFLADVAGVSDSQVRVVKGERNIPQIKESSREHEISLEELAKKSNDEQYEILCGNTPALKIRKMLAQSPHAATTPEILYELQTVWKNVSKQDVWKLFDCMASANNGSSSYLPIRAHFFQKTLNGIYACTNTDCSHMPSPLKGSDWKYGQIYLSERDFCHCGAPVQPIVSCNSCGQEYLEAEEYFLGDGVYEIQPPTRHDNDDEFIWDIESDEEEHNDNENEAAREHLILHYQRVDDSVPVRIQKNTRKLAHKNGDIILYGKLSIDFACATCGAKDRSGWKVFVPKRLGAPFFLGDSLPTLLEHSPRHGDGPFESRRLLTFTDSRQGTARIAARLQQDVDRNKVRSVLYHAVHVSEDLLGSDKLIKLQDDIKTLDEVVKTHPNVKEMLDGKRKELKDLESPAFRVLSWQEAAHSLNNSKDVSWYMFDAFQEIASTHITKEQFGDFTLFREFMRRPRRGFQLETLGMVEMFFPEIEILECFPDSWGQLYIDKEDQKANALNDWKDWLINVIDVHLRANSGVDFPREWGKLMGAKVTRKDIVGPKDIREQYVLRWPSVRRSTRSKVVRLLSRGFKLDLENNEVLDHIEQVLDDTWFIMRGTVLNSYADSIYLLNLKEKAAFRKVTNAWKCPYSHRLVARVFRGQSPNTPARDINALACEVVELPSLPFPNETNTTNRLKITSWLETDPLLGKAREMGVWPNRADRIATGEPWFRIVEHSAQIDSQELKRYEKMFKEGKLNVLSCSTTMEMGVDIGGMSVVAMNNVPPHPANYLQRAGRAGRRNEATSVCYTLCKQSAHSMQVFNEPKWPFMPGQIAVPRISLESANIVQRHVNALLFSFWLSQFGDDIRKLTSGWLLEKSSSDQAVVDDFIAWCRSIKVQGEYERLSSSVKSITKKTSLHSKPLEVLAEQTALMIDVIYEKWWDEFGIMLDESNKIAESSKRPNEEPAYKAINISLNRMRDEYLLRDLANGGFLPGYGFPTHVVSLNNITMRELTKIRQNGREDGFGKNRGIPSRDLAVALREYAPGAEIVIKGLVYRSAGITLNWHRPSNLDAAPEIQNLYHHWECKKCGEFGDSNRLLSFCLSCNADSSKLKMKEVLEPAGFAVDLFEDPHTDVNRPTFMPYEDAKVAAIDAMWKVLPNNLLGRIRYSENGLVSHVSSGLYGHGYTLCLCCGRAEPQTGENEPVSLVTSEHKRLRGGKDLQNSPLCEGPGNDYMIRRDLYLASKIQTSVFELQLRDPRDNYMPVRDPTIGWTVGFALRNALTKRLGVDQREVEVALRDMRFDDEKSGFALCLYDTASQGAGYVERLQEDLFLLMRETLEHMACPASCDSACQHCLLDNGSQFKEDHLDRGVAAEWLSEWLNACELPNDKFYFGENSSVNLSPLSNQLERLVRKSEIDRVCLFLELSDEDPSDLASWSMVDMIQRLLSSGIEVEWVLVGDINVWKDRCGYQIAAFMDIFNKRLSVSHLQAKNNISGQGKMIMAAILGGQGHYWAGENAELLLNGEWGSVDGPIITTKDWMKKIEFNVSMLKSNFVRPEIKNISASVRLNDDLDGATKEFGRKFINWIKVNLPGLGETIDKGEKLLSISYSDRYLRAPVHVILLYKLFYEFSKACGDESTKLNITTTFMQSSDRQPFKVFHNFGDSNERDHMLNQAISSISENFKFNVASHNRETSHARTLILEFHNGSLYEMDFDQGMGAWNYSGSARWDSYEADEKKLKLILNDKGSVHISGKWGVLINIRKIN